MLTLTNGLKTQNKPDRKSIVGHEAKQDQGAKIEHEAIEDADQEA